MIKLSRALGAAFVDLEAVKLMISMRFVTMRIHVHNGAYDSAFDSTRAGSEIGVFLIPTHFDLNSYSYFRRQVCLLPAYLDPGRMAA